MSGFPAPNIGANIEAEVVLSGTGITQMPGVGEYAVTLLCTANEPGQSVVVTASVVGNSGAPISPQLVLTAISTNNGPAGASTVPPPDGGYEGQFPPTVGYGALLPTNNGFASNYVLGLEASSDVANVSAPAANIQRRRVCAFTSPSSSLAKCSAANLGPNRSPSSPEYFFPTNRNTRSRNFLPFFRFDSRPALRCFSPSAPSS